MLTGKFGVNKRWFRTSVFKATMSLLCSFCWCLLLSNFVQQSKNNNLFSSRLKNILYCPMGRFSVDANHVDFLPFKQKIMFHRNPKISGKRM